MLLTIKIQTDGQNVISFHEKECYCQFFYLRENKQNNQVA